MSPNPVPHRLRLAPRDAKKCVQSSSIDSILILHDVTGQIFVSYQCQVIFYYYEGSTECK